MIMSTPLAARVETMAESATLAIAAKTRQLAAEGIDIIPLSIGEPDYDTPLHIKAAGIDAIHEGLTRYTPVAGTLSLRESIVRKLELENNLTYSVQEVMACCGAKQAIINAMLAILNPGDEVLIPAPYWTSYPDMCRLAEATPVIIDTTKADQYKLRPESLAAAITPKTRLLILNSPSNPSGMVYSKDELTALASVLHAHPDIRIISDDIYEHIIWQDKSFHNLVNVDPAFKERTIIVNGVSKTFAMTGWRIGYAAGPESLIKAMTKIQSQSTSNPCSIAQAAAQEALNTGIASIADMIHSYEDRYHFTREALAAIPGIDLIPSDGTFYLFPEVSGLISHLGLADDMALTDFLLEKAHVSVVPGSVFGCPQHIRLSFALNKKRIQEAVERMQAAIEQHINPPA
jgi:aspartate aminotransferase